MFKTPKSFNQDIGTTIITLVVMLDNVKILSAMIVL